MKWEDYPNDYPVTSTKMNQMCIPKLTTTERDSLTTSEVIEGMIIYNTTTKMFEVCTSTNPITWRIMLPKVSNTEHGVFVKQADGTIEFLELPEYYGIRKNLDGKYIACPVENYFHLDFGGRQYQLEESYLYGNYHTISNFVDVYYEIVSGTPTVTITDYRIQLKTTGSSQLAYALLPMQISLNDNFYIRTRAYTTFGVFDFVGVVATPNSSSGGTISWLNASNEPEWCLGYREKKAYLKEGTNEYFGTNSYNKKVKLEIEKNGSNLIVTIDDVQELNQTITPSTYDGWLCAFIVYINSGSATSTEYSELHSGLNYVSQTV